MGAVRGGTKAYRSGGHPQDRKRDARAIMAVTETTPVSPAVESVVRDCAAALQRVATYRLPAAVDRRLLWLSENKERLSAEEREELLAVVEFTQERTAERLQAQALLERLAQLRPEIKSPQP